MPEEEKKREGVKPKDPGGAKDAPPRRRAAQGRAGSQQRALSQVEDRLNEMFATVAMGQAAASIATGDARHAAGAAATNQLSPPLVRAWINLAQENEAVAKVLIRLSQTSAWGEVIIASTGLVYTQAQIYGMVPVNAPNPFFSVEAIPVPVSDEVRQHAATAPPGETEDARAAAAAAAEAERQRIEDRRRERGS